jgi:ubiquinone/menaquinone biosynthesis C-methylase UbiE
MTEPTTTEARKTWESAAPGWAQWEDIIAVGFRSATETLLDMANVRDGTRLLDLACGAGSQTFQAAERVGAQGSVVASDISPTMLSHVRDKAKKLGVQNIETLECAAEDLKSSVQVFDAAICRLGLMLFPDPAGAAMAVKTSLIPGGRFAALVFTTPPNNPYMAEPMQILLRNAGMKAPPPGSPGIFALVAPGVLEAKLTEGGYSDIETTVVRPILRLDSASQALEMMQGAFGVYRAVVADLPENDRKAAWSQVGEFLSQFESASGWEAELEVIIASGAAST